MALLLSSLQSSSVPNWALLQTATPTGASTVTFSGLSGYSKYRILAPNITCTTGNSSLWLRLNGDSGTNYLYSSASVASSALGGGAITGALAQLTLATITNVNVGGIMFEVDHALLAIPKFVSGKAAAVGGDTFDFVGFYNTTSTLTSITLLMGTNNFSTGSIYLLGVN